MLRSYHRHSHPTPYGMHRFRGVHPSAIRYPRSRLPYRQMMMGRPRFYPPPFPLEKNGFFDGLLAILAALFCLNRGQTNRRPISSGGGDDIGGSSSCGGGGDIGGSSNCGSGGDIGGSSNCGSGGDVGGSSSCGGGGGGSCGGGGGGSCGGGGGGSCGGGGGGCGGGGGGD